jgi:signal transduction histidine kinase/DNA-binding NarL/FixJ family response regulator
MLIPGTQMHIVTFLFVCIEIVILFYLLIYSFTRPDDKTAVLDIILIFLLLVFNIASGLLPDTNLPGSFFIQESIAYATGFIAPSYFPYYLYKAFGLEKMKFHAYIGVYLFLILPYIIFVIVLGISNNLDAANYVLIVPVLYAAWVFVSLVKSFKFKYANVHRNSESIEEMAVVFLSLTPWVSEPAIVYFNVGQAIEAAITNIGFLLLFSLHVKRHIKAMRREHQRLIESEQRLLQWNNDLQVEVEKRTSELQKINEQRTNAFVNLAHEIKTPITLINNYLEEFIIKNRKPSELKVVKKSIDKLSNDISNFFTLERFNKGMANYNHELIADFSRIVEDSLLLFSQYADKRKIKIKDTVENGILVKADPVSINQVVNNLVENAIKFSDNNTTIEVVLYCRESEVHFLVTDHGPGIPIGMRKKVFEPYYQIANRKTNAQGMGLGLPIVNKIIEDLNGKITIESNPESRGTKMHVFLNKHILNENEIVTPLATNNKIITDNEDLGIKETRHEVNKQTVFIVEDNIEMLNYLILKLNNRFNVYGAMNGNEALTKLKSMPTLPHLIISDVMMDKMDGYTFAKVISNEPLYNHIPFIFLTARSGRNDRIEGLKLGAIDFIQKPFSIHELLQKVESILSITGKQKRAILNSAFNILTGIGKNPPFTSEHQKFEQNCKFYNLTAREIEIARLICEGKTYETIGNTLFISKKTVAKHIQNIFEKVQVASKVELVNKLKVP